MTAPESASRKPKLTGAVARLGCYRGIAELNSLALAAEVVDWRRFPSARAFMGFTGLCPASTPAAIKPAAARSPKPAPSQCAPLWWRLRGPTGSSPRSASRCAAGNATRSRAPWPAPGKRNAT